MVIKVEQIRAARALLNWNQKELAERAGISEMSIINYETGKRTPHQTTLDKILQAFEMAGVVFTKNGVEKRDDVVSVLEGEDVNILLLEDIYRQLKDTGGEVLIAGLSEVAIANEAQHSFLKAHIQRLLDAGISERILLEEGDKNIVAPAHWYRWLPKGQGEFTNTPFQLYGDKLALIEFSTPPRIVLIKHSLFAQTFKNLFEAVWAQAKTVDVGGV